MTRRVWRSLPPWGAVAVVIAATAPSMSPAAPPQAQPGVFEAMQRYCLATGADPERVIALAEADGLPQAPPEVLIGAPLEHAQARVLGPDGSILMIGT
ncbi:MAG TPA: hypothetical protein VG939_02850, partial [Caulobacteraceae bacterium]|nr:hypothetical protein [Caulobacteraceae bacterium]